MQSSFYSRLLSEVDGTRFSNQGGMMMGPKPRINIEDRGKVLELSEEGYSQRVIAVCVGCSQRRVCEILEKKKKLTGSVKDLKIPGRKRKTTRSEDRTMVGKSMSDRYKTAPEIKAKIQIEHGVNVSTSTTRRRLREAGHIGRKPGKKPRLTLRHKKARLEFARTHKNWTAEQWSQTIFSDESRVLLHRSDGRVYVRRMAGEEFMGDSVQPTVKHRGWWDHGFPSDRLNILTVSMSCRSAAVIRTREGPTKY